MGYMKIPNLYRPEAQAVLLFKKCCVMEKIHGTSAHITWKDGRVTFSSGGVKHDDFVKLFDADALAQGFTALGHDSVTVYGEAYGGKCQGMSKTYGPALKFIAFEVKVADCWLSVHQAADVVAKLGLEFVHYDCISTDLNLLDDYRDFRSIQAMRNGIMEPRPREGIVIRPMVEMQTNDGKRVIAKHKSEKFSETKTPRRVDPDALAVLTDAEAIADEWVTDMRLAHVLQKFREPHDIGITGEVVKAMIDDVLTEGEGEIVDSRAARQAVGRRTAKLFKARLHKKDGREHA